MVSEGRRLVWVRGARAESLPLPESGVRQPLSCPLPIFTAAVPATHWPFVSAVMGRSPRARLGKGSPPVPFPSPLCSCRQRTPSASTSPPCPLSSASALPSLGHGGLGPVVQAAEAELVSLPMSSPRQCHWPLVAQTIASVFGGVSGSGTWPGKAQQGDPLHCRASGAQQPDALNPIGWWGGSAEATQYGPEISE